jgi:hypothetical protein
MKRRALYLIVVCCLILAAPVSNAEPQNTQVPQKIGVLYQVHGELLTELPRLTGKKKTATLITARSKLRMELQGKTSTIILEDAKPTFVVSLPGGDITKLSLYPLTVSGSNREAVIGTGGSIYGESTTGADTLPVDASKAGADVYRITPSAALRPGEYALAFGGSNEFSCFTIR